jgi:hypothetical protein
VRREILSRAARLGAVACGTPEIAREPGDPKLTTLPGVVRALGLGLSVAAAK